MAATDLSERTKTFALRIIRFVQALPKDETSRVIGKQLLRAGTSVGANYCPAKRTKSTAHFISKLGDVEEECDECIYWMECDECIYWMELTIEAGLVKPTRILPLLNEANELLAIIVTSIKTARKHLPGK